MEKLTAAPILALVFFATSCASDDAKGATARFEHSVEVVTPDQVAYQPLNPARGDASPQAGILWGDIRIDEPSGILLRFADGFSSPPHIHNITYRAVVISGYVHNDDPNAEDLWMGPGSYWMQPAGEVHITSAKEGAAATAFLEILQGPYLVKPGIEAFDNGERPISLLASNIVWLNADDVKWIDTDGEGAENGPKAAALWGSTEQGRLGGSFVQLPEGYDGALSSVDGDLRSVVIKGELLHEVRGTTEPSNIGPGGYFASNENIEHTLSCNNASKCIIYVRTAGRFIVK